MNGRGRYGWGFALAAVLFTAAIAMIAYNFGVSDGVATSGAGAGVEAVRRVQWGWHGGFALWPLFWIFVIAFIWRGACWRRHYWYGGPYFYGPRPPVDADDEFERWHRRAHERMKEDRPADDSGRRG